MRKSLSQEFLDAGLLTAAQVEQALAESRRSGRTFRDATVELGLTTREAVCELVARVRGLPFFKSLQGRIDAEEAWKWLPEAVARKCLAVPISRFEQSMTVALANPFDVDAVSALATASGVSVAPVAALEESIVEALNHLYRQHEGLLEIVGQIVSDSEDEEESLKTFDVMEDVSSGLADAPVVRLVNSVLARAVRERASDVHVEPDENGSRVRHRVDGMLREVMTIPKLVHRAVVSRVKVMGELDIAERRTPQDGRIRIRLDDKAVDLRISTLPSLYGEKVVIRILDRSATVRKLSEIGFEGVSLERLSSALRHPSGLILVTGPTGSGKTTTLYTSLAELNSHQRNIITLEDPIEYKLSGVNQVQINPKAGVSFSTGLRSILRQDPDVIMVGEMRDLETAQMAIRAALTGHLVLSTLHTNDAAGAVVRLVEMGVEPYLVANSLICVVAQRLVRQLCQRCRQPVPLPAELLDSPVLDKLSGPPMTYKPGSCTACSGSGFKGRLAVMELLTVTEPVRDLLQSGRAAQDLAKLASNEGMVPLWEHGVQLILAGETTLDELSRVAKPPGVDHLRTAPLTGGG